MLVRSWNLFNGNTDPPGRRAYLREQIELITADRPDVVCLQEVPGWALGEVGDWADMQAVAVKTRRGKLPFGRRITSLHAGLFRSALGGQGNAILLARAAKLRETKQITLNTNPFCEAECDRMELSRKLARRWERERRVCHLAKVELPDRRRVLVANLHATHLDDPRLPDAELRRAFSFVDRAAELEETVIVGGDFNVTLEQSETLRALTTRVDERYSAAFPRIDHLLVRNWPVQSSRVWPEEERRYDGKLLSDHAPVEVVLVPAQRPAPRPPADEAES